MCLFGTCPKTPLRCSRSRLTAKKRGPSSCQTITPTPTVSRSPTIWSFVVFGIEYDSAHRTIFTHNYAPDGTRVWEDAYTPDNSATPWIYVTDLALSPSGAVVMVGYIGGPKTTYRGFVRAVAQ